MQRLLTIAALTLASASFAFGVAGPPSAPEIDANSAVSAVTLLSGALIVFRARRKR